MFGLVCPAYRLLEQKCSSQALSLEPSSSTVRPQEFKNHQLAPKKIEDRLRNQENNKKKSNKSWILFFFLPIFDSGSFQDFLYSYEA